MRLRFASNQLFKQLINRFLAIANLHERRLGQLNLISARINKLLKRFERGDAPMFGVDTRCEALLEFREQLGIVALGAEEMFDALVVRDHTRLQK